MFLVELELVVSQAIAFEVVGKAGNRHRQECLQPDAPGSRPPCADAGKGVDRVAHAIARHQAAAADIHRHPADLDVHCLIPVADIRA